jgi:hypothetical protein
VCLHLQSAFAVGRGPVQCAFTSTLSASGWAAQDDVHRSSLPLIKQRQSACLTRDLTTAHTRQADGRSDLLRMYSGSIELLALAGAVFPSQRPFHRAVGLACTCVTARSRSLQAQALRKWRLAVGNFEWLARRNNQVALYSNPAHCSQTVCIGVGRLLANAQNAPVALSHSHCAGHDDC